MNKQLVKLNPSAVPLGDVSLQSLLESVKSDVKAQDATTIDSPEFDRGGFGYFEQVLQLCEHDGYMRASREVIDVMRSIYILSEIAAAPNIRNGFWDDLFRIIREHQDDRAILTCVLQSRLSLILTEPCEGVEATRLPLEQLYSLDKDSLARELAGCIIRCLDLARCIGLNIGAAFLLEIARNLQRGYKHGKTS